MANFYLTKEMAWDVFKTGAVHRGERSEGPRFKVGDLVRTKNQHPMGHTRLPRYARGKVGTIERYQGCFIFADSRAALKGDDPQPIYRVRFKHQELWGNSYPYKDSLSLDIYEDYLEPDPIERAEI